MPWKPAYAGQYLDKLEDARKVAADKLKAANADKSANFSDRIKTVRGSQTAVGARWDQEAAARRQAQGLDEVEGAEHGGSAAAATSAGDRHLPPSRALGYRGPPPQRTGASVASTGSAAAPPPPPPRPSNAATGVTRPPLPARSSTQGSGSAPPLPPGRGGVQRANPPLPPRMNNESGTAHPPPPYKPTPAADEATAALDNMSISAAAAPPPPARRGPPPVPATRKPGPPPIPGNRPQPSSASRAAAPASPQAPAAPPSRPQAPPRPAASSSAPAAAPVALVPLSCSRHPSTEACKALTAATFFCYPSHYPEWSSPTPWFASRGQGQLVPPPSLEGRKDLFTKSAWMSYGPSVKIQGVLQFDDLSTLWYQISYTAQDAGNFECKVSYAEPPSPWGELSHPGLLKASAEGYGELVARKVEQWEGTVVGDGECWTLAAQALQEVNREQGYAPDVQMLESVGRTHGHLVYHASIDGASGQATGVWRGGDVGQVRRGDIVEWATSTFYLPDGRTVSLGAPERGMPDHTAVIIGVTPPPRGNPAPASASHPSLPPDQYPLTPSELVGSITVLEQAAGQVVHRTSFPFGDAPRAWTSGALWIFRPVGRESLLEGGVEPGAWEGEGERTRRKGWEPLN